MRVIVFAALLASLLSLHAMTAGAGNESVEADASSRSVAITSSFTGTEIVVFGTVENSEQPSPEAGTYDVVIVAEGVPTPVVVHRKSSIGGLWINTKSIRFASLPSFYAIASTRPIEEIAEKQVLDDNQIGFDHIRIVPAGTGTVAAGKPEDAEAFRQALIKLKENDRLYIQSSFGVTFIGRSLFRATLSLPPNVPIGPLVARVYLFRDGKLLSHYTSHVALTREGIERYIHEAALRKPLRYGLVTVLIAASAGLAAAFGFRRFA
jgi:uncharacterized protein (TIGR02186 family)